VRKRHLADSEQWVDMALAIPGWAATKVIARSAPTIDRRGSDRFQQKPPLPHIAENSGSVQHFVRIKQPWHSCIQLALKRTMIPDPSKGGDLFLRKRTSWIAVVNLLPAMQQEL
jgi:hypothetical protein